ncbi:MAG: NTPase [Thermoplasmata archaeon]
MGKGVKIGITGLPGSGKSQALIKVIEMLEADNIVVGGMVTGAIIEENQRVGVFVKDWTTKEQGVMAHINSTSKINIDGFGVDISELDRVGVKAINTAVDNAEVIVIDEVGRMEVESANFVATVKKAMETTKPIILTLHKKSRNPLLQDIRRRDDLRILEVTPINRNILPYKIIKLLRGECL